MVLGYQDLIITSKIHLGTLDLLLNGSPGNQHTTFKKLFRTSRSRAATQKLEPLFSSTVNNLNHILSQFSVFYMIFTRGKI